MGWILCGDIMYTALVSLVSERRNISEYRKPHVMDPTKNLDGEEMDESLTLFKQQRLQSGM